MTIGNKDFDPTQMLRANEAIRKRKEQIVSASEFDAGAVLSDQIEGGQKFQASIGDSGELSLTAKGGAAPAVNVVNLAAVPTKGGGAILPSNQAGSNFRGQPSSSEGLQSKIDLTKMMDQIDELSVSDPEQAKFLSAQLGGLVVTAQQAVMAQYQSTAYTEFGVAIQQQAVNMEGAVDADVRRQNPGMTGSSPNFDAASRQLASADAKAQASGTRRFGEDTAWAAIVSRSDAIIKSGGILSKDAAAAARTATVIIKSDVAAQTAWEALADGQRLQLNTIALAWGIPVSADQPHLTLERMEPDQKDYAFTRMTNPEQAKALVYATGSPLQDAALQAEIGFELAAGANEQEASSRVAMFMRLGQGLTTLESTPNRATSSEGVEEALRKIDPELQLAAASPMWAAYEAAAKQVKMGDPESSDRGKLVLPGARNALIQDTMTRIAHAKIASGTVDTPLLRPVPPANEEIQKVYSIQQANGGFPSPVKTALQYLAPTSEELAAISADRTPNLQGHAKIIEAQKARAQEVQKWFQEYAKQNNDNSGKLAIDANEMYREVLAQQLELFAFNTIEDQLAESALRPIFNSLGAL